MPDFKVSITRWQESLPRTYEAITLSEYHYQGIYTELMKDLESPNFLLTAAGKSIEGAAAHPTQYPFQARCCTAHLPLELAIRPPQTCFYKPSEK